MKKTLISFLIMTSIVASLSLTNLQSVQAATTDDTSTISTDDTIKVSLENIKDIMTENNLEIKILLNEVKIQRESYNAAKDDYETKKDERDSAEEAYDEAVAAGEDTTEEERALETAEEDLDDAEETLDDERDSLKKIRDSYEQGIQDKVYAAQEDYISYLSSLAELNIQEDEAKSYEKDLQVYKLKYDHGFISKNEYTSLIQENTTSVNDLKESQSAEELAKTKLCYTLGLNPEGNIIFEDEITFNLDVIAQINYSQDLDKMLNSNNDIQLQNDEIDDLEDEEDTYEDEDLYDYEVENADLELQDLINDAETSFKAQYNTVINSYNAIKNDYNILIEKEKSYKITETKYDYGYVSKKELETAKHTLDSDRATFNKSKNTLYINYLRYLQMKEGY